MKAKTFPEETQRVVDHLYEAFGRAGRGSMSRVARAVGLHDSFYSEKKRRKKRYDVGVLLATLRELEIRPGVFFAELDGSVVGHDSGLGGPEPIAERSTPETRRAVRLAYRRMRAELAGVDLVPELEDLAGDIEIPAAGGPPLGAEWLESLDARRQDEPEAVAGEVVVHLDRVEVSLLPRAIGVWSSALRLALDLETAAYLNRWAVRLAQAAGDSATIGGLYIRRALIVADTGDHDGALVLAKMAAGEYACLGDQAGQGQALVDCGRFLFYLGRYQEARAANERALAVLPDSMPRSRLGALHCLGRLCLDLGDLKAGDEYLELAQPLATTLCDRAKLLWLRASIRSKLGRRCEAENLLRQVVELYREIHPGEASLAAVELVQVMLEQGKSEEARNFCRSMLPLLEMLEANPITDAAFGELLRAGVYGTLTIDLVKRIKNEIENARFTKDATARQQWRALVVTAQP